MTEIKKQKYIPASGEVSLEKGDLKVPKSAKEMIKEKIWDGIYEEAKQEVRKEMSLKVQTEKASLEDLKYRQQMMEENRRAQEQADLQALSMLLKTDPNHLVLLGASIIDQITTDVVLRKIAENWRFGEECRNVALKKIKDEKHKFEVLMSELPGMIKMFRDPELVDGIKRSVYLKELVFSARVAYPLKVRVIELLDDYEILHEIEVTYDPITHSVKSASEFAHRCLGKSLNNRAAKRRAGLMQAAADRSVSEMGVEGA